MIDVDREEHIREQLMHISISLDADD